MQILIKSLVALASIAFILAVVKVLNGYSPMGVQAESLSRTCSNLALIAIALSLSCKCCRKKDSED